MATNVEQTYQERILNVLVYIQNHLDNELTLEELSAVACFSPFHFHRVFTAHTSESFKSYIRRLRLERAARDLAFSNLSINEITERAAFDTHQSFHRAFKDMFHETPATFREKAFEKIFPARTKKTSSLLTKPVEIKTIDPITVAFMRRIGPYSETHILEIWFKLVAQIGITTFLSDKVMRIGIPHDTIDITPSEKIRYDACISIDHLPNFKAKGDVGTQTIPGGQYAVIRHEGSFDKIEATYEMLFSDWMPNSGYEPADYPSFMVHRNMPLQMAADALITDIYLPIRAL